MNHTSLTPHLARIAEALDVEPVQPGWKNLDAILPLLHAIRRRKGVVLIKFDGEREPPEDNGQFTVLITQTGVPDTFSRAECEVLEDAVALAIVRFADDHLGIPLPDAH